MSLTADAAALVEWAKGSKSPLPSTANAGDGITLQIWPWADILSPVEAHASKVEQGEKVIAYVGPHWDHRSDAITFPEDLTAAAEQAIEQVRASMWRQAQPLRDLTAINRRREVVAAELAEIDAARDEAILAAVDAGYGAPTIGSFVGLTAARVYQIRDGRAR